HAGLGERLAALEPLGHGHEARVLKLAQMDGEIAVGGLQPRLEGVEVGALQPREDGHDAEADTAMDDLVEAVDVEIVRHAQPLAARSSSQFGSAINRNRAAA